MAGHSKKSTKKFEKNHLKDTLEKRKDFAKIKQRHQVKEKRKARNAKDRPSPPAEKPAGDSAKAASKAKDRLNGMSVDQFFEGGFELPEPKKTVSTTKSPSQLPSGGKRKRASSTSQGNGPNESPDLDEQHISEAELTSGEEESDLENHQEDLDALASKDPDFYKYLQENDAELLEFGGGDLAEVDQLSEEEKPRKKRKIGLERTIDDGDHEAELQNTSGQTEVTTAILNTWKSAMTEQFSLRAMRRAVLAFRSAAYVNSDEGKDLKYSIPGPDVYHQTLMLALEHVPSVLHHHLPVKESAMGKVRVATDTKKYRTLTPLLKSHSTAIIHLLGTLSDEATTKTTLHALLPLLPYLLPFKKVLKSLVKTTVDIWSDTSTTDPTRITAFLVIRRLVVISDASIRTALLKTAYQGLVKGSRITNPHTLPAINLMKNSAAELWGLDLEIGYTTGFVYIRQLAVHLRNSTTQPGKDNYKQIYNWQYIHSLDFWSRVISMHCAPGSNPVLKKASDSALHPLLYPLVQITLGALRLIPTSTYFPLRFQLTRSLLRLSRATATYIPLAPSLLEVLQSNEMTEAPKPSTMKALDFGTALRVPKTYVHTRIYQDGLGEQVTDLMAEFFGIWAKHIAFPELALPPVVHLKRWLKAASSTSKPRLSNGTRPNSDKAKGNKNSRLTSSIAILVQKLESNSRWIEDRRRQVEFGPSNREGVERFLEDVAIEDTPIGAFVEGLRRKSEERERMLEQAREADRRDRAKDKEKQKMTDVDDVGAVEMEEEDAD
ncbi:MAG: hypothetical protein Q9220_005610 [cf. Caloplaca sp. 1 TL-2023]